MEKGIEIGGMVVNEKGEPIAGALVQVKSSASHPNGNRPGYVGFLAEEDDELKTDEQGRWTLNNVPDTADQEIEVLLEHPDYLRDATWGEYQKRQGITTAMFRDKSARIVMSQGVAVTGTINAPDGSPIGDGLVVWGDNPYMENGSQETRIVDGQFETTPLPPGEKRFTVMAPDWSPQTRVVEIHPMMETVDFEMVPGKTLSVLVVDADNNPIPGAFVQIGKWRGVEAIYNHRHPNVIDSRIPILADQGGMYRWTWAPDDEIEVSVGMPGYSFESDIKITAGDKTRIVKLRRPSSISGVVVDKTTGLPIDGVSVIPIGVSPTGDGSERFRESRSDAVATTDGEFQLSLIRFSGREKKYQLRLEVSGYAPLESDVFDDTNVPTNPRYELEPAIWPTGRVVDNSGNPVKDAVVHLATARSTLSIRSFTSSRIGSGYVVRTVDDGSFVIPPMNEPFTLIAGHKTGYAEVVYQPGQSLGDMQLEAWASVEGHVVDESGVPVSGLTFVADPVRYQYGKSYHIQHHHGATTDDTGFFRFDELPPMRFAIRTVAHTSEQINTSSSIPIIAKPGETTTVDFGKGILVKGRINMAGSIIPMDHTRFNAQIVPIAPPPIGFPDGLTGYDWQEGLIGYRRFSKENHFQTFMPVLHSIPFFNPGIGSDGTFRFQLPRSGEYDLSISAMGQHPDSMGEGAAMLGERLMRITIEQPDKPDAPIDLGEIEVTVLPTVQTGEELPNLSLSTDDGKTIELVSLRGKVFLLDFWSPWCQVCEADKSRLTEFADQLLSAGEGKTTILSVRIRESGQFSRAPEEGSPVWLGGQLSDVNELRALGVYSVPRYLIADEEGRLIYHGNLEGAIEFLNAR